VLRRSRIDGAKNAAAVIKLLVQRLRRAWPQARIIVRGDSGFCRQRLLRWCERSGVSYIIGLARNARLEAQVRYAELMLAEQYEATGVKQRLIDEFIYAADSWDIERRVITRLEHGAQGNNPRFVVTDLQADAAQLYERLYCARGEAENRSRKPSSICSARARAATASRPTSFACCWRRWPTRSCSACASSRSRAPSSSALPRQRSGCACSRSGPLLYATPVACACCWHRIPAARRLPQRRAGPGPMNPIQCCPRHVDEQWG